MVFANNLIHKIMATRSHQVDPDEYGDIGNKRVSRLVSSNRTGEVSSGMRIFFSSPGTEEQGHNQSSTYTAD